jgi:hypothetical protein
MTEGMYNGVTPRQVKPLAKNRKVGWLLLSVILFLIVGSIVYVQIYNAGK